MELGIVTEMRRMDIVVEGMEMTDGMGMEGGRIEMTRIMEMELKGIELT